jgi:DNA adenine methylase
MATYTNINTKTPISYYGGKQNMLQHILPLIPPHKLYCEPFFGGGAVYFAKMPSQIEVINDKNDFVINFYRCLKLRFDELKAEVEASLIR